MARRFYIVGIAGSGKTTVSRTIAQRLGITHVELDALFHGPNWSLPPAGEFERRVTTALDGLDDWVVDGNYRSRIGGHVLERADNDRVARSTAACLHRARVASHLAAHSRP